MERIDTVCFGGEDWWYHNRAHIDMQLMRCFAQLGTVLYVNSIVIQKPTFKKNIGGGKSLTQKLVRKTKSILKGLKKSDAGFWVYSPASLPVHHIDGLRRINELILRSQLRFVTLRLGVQNPVIWVACPAACNVAIKMKKRNLVYQRTDRFEEYPNIDTKIIRQYDQKLKANADLVIFVNRHLYDAESKQCKKAIYLDHGVDYKMFATAENSEAKPIDMRDIRGPIVGYFGGIDNHSSDIAFMQTVVDLLPQMSFVFVGQASADTGGLQKMKNVRLLGQKPYEQIPDYGKCFNVAIMPLKRNRWIEACNPIKLKEYLALGKPVVSTPFPELQKYFDVVYIADTPEEFAQCIKRALAENNPERIAARREKVQTSTWDNKAELVLEELFGKACDFEDSN